jgi:hypothetical protein
MARALLYEYQLSDHPWYRDVSASHFDLGLGIEEGIGELQPVRFGL